MTREHWTATAERVTDGFGLIGEDDYGTLRVKRRDGLYRVMDRRKPLDALRYVWSWARRRMIFL